MANIIKKKDQKIYYKNDPKLKAHGVDIEWTPEDILEYQKCKDDIIYFVKNYIKIISLDRGVVPFEMYDYQIDLVNLMNENRFLVTKWPRQSGKSITTVAYFLHSAIFNSNKNIAIFANKAKTARGILKKLKKAYRELPLFLQPGIIKWNEGSIELSNGTCVFADATSESASRSESVNFLYVDETSFIPRGIIEEFMKSVYPTIASSKESKIFLTSTPNGLDLFYKIFTDAKKGRNEFKHHEIQWYDVPGRDESFKEKTISNIGQEAWDQEFEAQFLGSSNTLINGSTLSSLVYQDPIQTKEYAKIYYKPEPGHSYVVSVDVSEGLGQDYSVINVTDITKYPYQQVAIYRNDAIDPNLLPDVIVEFANLYNEAYVLVEANNIGGVVCNILHNTLEYENLIRTETRGRSGVIVSAGFGSNKSIVGVKTTKLTKRIGCTQLKSLVENKKYIINDFETISELSTFSRSGDSYAAEEGNYDDICMSLVIFAWLVNDNYFKDLIEKDIRDVLKHEDTHLKHLEESLLPFGFIDDGVYENDDNTPLHLQNGAVWGWGGVY